MFGGTSCDLYPGSEISFAESWRALISLLVARLTGLGAPCKAASFATRAVEGPPLAEILESSRRAICRSCANLFSSSAAIGLKEAGGEAFVKRYWLELLFNAPLLSLIALGH